MLRPKHLELLSSLTFPLIERNVYTGSALNIDQKWRKDKGLPANPNAFGPLTNLPDYTFLDGRPTPLGSNQKRRLIKQREIAATIVTMSKELDYAKERYRRLQEEQDAQRRTILQNKLKSKGKYLLKEVNK